MSYEMGEAALDLDPTPRIAHTEYVNDWEVVRHFTGKGPRQHPEAWRELDHTISLLLTPAPRLTRMAARW